MSNPRKRRTRWVSAACLAVALGGVAYRARERPAGPLGPAAAAYRARDWAEAAALARARLTVKADDNDAVRLLARASARLGRDDSARRLYARLGALKQEGAEDFYVLGLMLARQGKAEAARLCWERGRPLGPSHGELLAALAGAELRAERLLPAAEDAGRLARLPGWEGRGGWLLADAVEALNRPGEAVGPLRAALAAPPEGVSAAAVRKRLVRDLLASGQVAEASAALAPLLAPGADAEAFWLSSRVLLREGKAAEAEAALARGPGDHGREPAEFVGAGRCASCHAGVFRDEQASRHARTLWRGEGLAGLPVTPGAVADPGSPEARQELSRAGGGLSYEARAGGEVFRAVVDYAFGSGDRGLTYVGHEAGGASRELRLSHYAGGAGWAVTAGQAEVPASPHDFLGRALDADGVRLCLFCHATDALSVRDKAGPVAADRGIGCERCHGPGGNHLDAVRQGFSAPAVARPGADEVKLCASCHSPAGREVTRDDPQAPRFQGATLTWSRCYTESNGALRCTTCHDPHRDAATDHRGYESRCLSCHGPESKAPTHTTCPINPRGECVTCHMPPVVMPAFKTTFTDHFIRSHPPGP